MPNISMFFGIIISMYYDDHEPPHFHAHYQNYTGSFNFDGDLISGRLPKKQVRLISAWTVIHREELEANWILRKRGDEPYKIEPLK